MRRALARLACIGMLAVAPACVRADVLLDGAQHVGDEERPAMTPVDPVRRTQMAASPSRFHLSQPTTITGVQLGTPRVYEVAALSRVEINGELRRGGFDAGSHTFTFNNALSLPAGVHTIAIDPGCLNPQGNPIPCPGQRENDASFGGIRLISAQTSTSRVLARRHHIGDDDEVNNDDYGGRFYPDRTEGLQLTETFSIDATRVLNQIQFYRLRDVETSGGHHARVLIDGVQVGVLASNGDPHTVGATLPLAAGTHTLTVIAGSNGPNDADSISWDGVLLLFSTPLGGVPGRFNAVDPGDAAGTGVIRTKVAGAAFALDIVALDLDRSSPLPGFLGPVRVELLDAGNDGGAPDAFGCRSSWSVVQSFGTLDFNASDQGRRTLSMSHANPLRVARVRIVDVATGISGCSTDAFAIRPADFAVQASHGDPVSPGVAQALDETGAGGARVHRAGRPFTVRVSARAVGGATLAGYSGSPILSVRTPIQGARPGTLITGSWTGSGGVRRTDGASYSEAGTFELAVTDTEFANVDAGDTPLSVRQFTGTAAIGRFTPDHFRLVSRNVPALRAACGGFGYVGQPFDFEPGLVPEAIVEAVNADGGRTLNYEGALAKLPAGLGVSSYRAVDGAGTTVLLDTGMVPDPDTSLDAQGAGTARIAWRPDVHLAVMRADAAVEPFDIEVELRAATLEDGDGVRYADPAVDPLRFGDAAPGGGIAFTGNARQQRYGRLFVQNAYGPETLPLDVVYGVETFFGATTGFGRNLADSCTLPGTVTLSEGIAAATSVQSISSPLVAGQGVIRLAPPAGAVIGTLNVKVSGDAWLLRPDADADGSADPAIGQAAFGRYRAPDRRIYQRETYR